jgi:hypothetical protein
LAPLPEPLTADLVINSRRLTLFMAWKV